METVFFSPKKNINSLLLLSFDIEVRHMMTNYYIKNLRLFQFGEFRRGNWAS